MPAPYLLNYVLSGLESSPRLLAALLKGRSDGDPVWNVRPDPERFNLREMVAHLADWDAVWLHRVQRICTEDNPQLPSVDEGEMAIANDYAGSSPEQSLARFAEARHELMEALRHCKPTDWSRTAVRVGVGELTLFEMAAMIAGHDAHHAAYAVECLNG